MAEQFEDLLARHVAGLSPAHRERMREHWELLSRWNRRINLSAIRDVEEAVVRHYGECVALARAVPEGAWRVADAGSGAGFPGIPFAIVRPECRVTLVEVDVRKSVFLREAGLSLANTVVFQGRIRDLPGEQDWLISRALHWQELREYSGAGQVALLVSEAQVAGIVGEWRGMVWDSPLAVSAPGHGVILTGRRE